MDIPDIIVAIDGYSSTGKSTFAKLIAKDLDYTYLDSGALYRAVTLVAMENGCISAEGDIDVPGLLVKLQSLDIHFVRDEKGTRTFIGERDVEPQIRTLAVSNLVSPVSAIEQVRAFVDNLLHSFGNKGRIVMDGRDIGTTVFPQAQLKIFMTAAPEVRAQRRFDELVAKGQNPDYQDVLKNLQDRDYIDSHREISPLRQAEDAIVLDNSEMTLSEQMAWVHGVLAARFGNC